MIRHGGDTYGNEGMLDFSACISPLGIPEAVKKAMIDAAGVSDRYPDIYCRDLRAALAGYVNGTWSDGVGRAGVCGGPGVISAEKIVCANGAADLIYRIVGALRPARALLFAPTFTEYERALTRAGCSVECYSSESLNVDEGFYDLIDSGIDIIFLCNPNNPTGFLIPPALLKKIAARCEECGVYLCVDECFLEFVSGGESHSVLHFLTPHIICIRAFTKIFALAGVRLGYGIFGCEDVARRVFEDGSPWSVSVIAQTAGVAAAGERDYIMRVRQLLDTERAYLAENLRELGFTVFDGSADYLLFRSGRDLTDDLKKAGILIRQCSDFRGLDETYYRIGVRRHEDNEKLIRALAGRASI